MKNAMTFRLISMLKNRSGDGYVDVLMKILIAVVLGAALLALLQAAMPELFQSMMDTIRGLLVI